MTIHEKLEEVAEIWMKDGLGRVIETEAFAEAKVVKEQFGRIVDPFMMGFSLKNLKAFIKNGPLYKDITVENLTTMGCAFQKEEGPRLGILLTNEKV